MPGDRRILNHNIRISNIEGSISVFLCLILLLIMSLLFTVIEGARVSTAKIYAERTLTTAMDSVLADYYGPLWEEYHIFGYNAGEGSITQQNEKITSTIQDYMSYTFSPNLNLDSYVSGKGLELFQITSENISVTGKTDLLDYEGKLLLNEAVEYMKYEEIGKGLEALLSKMGLLDTPEKVGYIMDEKQEVEEELVVIDQGILRLMELFDGLKTSKKGILLSEDGALQTTPPFIKMICYDEVTKENVGINQDSVFAALKGYYINPSIYFNQIKDNFTAIESELKAIEALQIEIIKEAELLTKEQKKLMELKSIEEEDDSDEVRLQIKLCVKRISSLQSIIEELKSQVEDKQALLREQVVLIKNAKEDITQLIKNISPLLNEAISCVDDILFKMETVAPLIEKYEVLLNSEKEYLEIEVFNGLEEELQELKKYITLEDYGYNFSDMKNILENNQEVLIKTEEELIKVEELLEKELYQSSEYSFQVAESILTSYQINGLELDYSTLILDKSAGDNPLGHMDNLIKNGITSLIIDTDSISQAEMDSFEMLPSELAALGKEGTDYLEAISSFMQNAVVGGKSFDIGSLFNNCDSSKELISALGDGVNFVAEQYLYQEYLQEHFGLYQSDEEKAQEQKPSALTYEQEYLLVGNTSDQSNLSSVVSRIVGLRTIMDFVSLLGDRTKREEAKLIATALVGFTGLTALIYITQVVILIVWAFAEALLDTCALMMGKDVPVLKKKIVLEFTDLFLISRQYLQQKAGAIVDTKELSFSYSDYLRIFLLIKNKEDLIYRSMDLIQENIKLRYGTDSFHIENCLFGYEVSAEFAIAEKFTGLSFVNQYLNSTTGDFKFTVKAAYSY